MPNFLFNKNLYNAEYFWEGRGCHGDRTEEDKEMVCGGVGEKLKIVWCVLVVRCNVESHQSVKKFLAGFVIAEKCVTVDMVQLAVVGRRATAAHPGNHTHIQTEQLV